MWWLRGERREKDGEVIYREPKNPNEEKKCVSRKEMEEE